MFLNGVEFLFKQKTVLVCELNRGLLYLLHKLEPGSKSKDKFLWLLHALLIFPSVTEA